MKLKFSQKYFVNVIEALLTLIWVINMKMTLKRKFEA